MTGRGCITRRGKKSWRLKFEVGPDPETGIRKTVYITTRGTRQEAQKELTLRLASLDAGTHVENSKTSVADWLERWLADQHGLAPKTVERYRELIRHQIIPHLGPCPLQKLRPAQIKAWHTKLLNEGRRKGGGLSARTVGHAHRVLGKALADALGLEVISRDVAAAVAPPKFEAPEVQILTQPQIAEVLDKLRASSLYPVAVLALATGMRRGELLALRWHDIDLVGAQLRVERSLEETQSGMRFKSPKTRNGLRSLTLPSSAVEVLRNHRRECLERRLALGLGKFHGDGLVFPASDGMAPMSPDNLSRDWARTCRRLRLPLVMFHSLRHTHASALIAAGLDVLTISRRLGHAKPTTTLNTYGHLFRQSDSGAAAAIEAALGTGKGT